MYQLALTWSTKLAVQNVLFYLLQGIYYKEYDDVWHRQIKQKNVYVSDTTSTSGDNNDLLLSRMDNSTTQMKPQRLAYIQVFFANITGLITRNDKTKLKILIEKVSAEDAFLIALTEFHLIYIIVKYI